jgi:hypothetical protein
MVYKEMKEIDLLSISSKEKALEIMQEVLNSDKQDILKYINYLRYQQFNSDDFKLMKKITSFLFFQDFQDIERENSDIDFGEIEELVFEDNVETFQETDFFINGETYNCKAQLSDDYETILIAKKGDEYVKFGCIVKDEHSKYIYDLENECEEYNDNIVSAENGSKANLLSVVHGDTVLRKTFIKEDINVDFNFIHVKKTDKGILSNIVSGTFLTIKEPENLLIVPEIAEDSASTEIDNSIQITSIGNGVGMMSGDDFSKMLDDIGGVENLEEKMKADIFADMLIDSAEDSETIDKSEKEKLKEMMSDAMRLSEDEYAAKWDSEINKSEINNQSEINEQKKLTFAELIETFENPNFDDMTNIEDGVFVHETISEFDDYVFNDETIEIKKELIFILSNDDELFIYTDHENNVHGYAIIR